MSRPARIAVVGSLNVDVTYRLPRIPSPGETLSSKSSETHWGGKGANQALAARRAGSEVEMIGCVGADDAGTRYREALKEEGVGTWGIQSAKGATGSAVIFVDDQGENTIVVDAGANALVDPDHIKASRSILEWADLLMLQLECSHEAVAQAARLARELGTLVMLNPSPWDDGFMKTGVEVDYLIANESETQRLLGIEAVSPAQLARQIEHPSGIGQLVVTRGAEPTLLPVGPDRVASLRPPQVTPIDTVGAGDSFAGALAVAIAEERSIEEAVSFANIAGALATQLPGAQTAIPTRDKIEEWLKKTPLG